MTERPGASAWVPERPALDALRSAAQECRGCELYRDATQAVMGEGPTDAATLRLPRRRASRVGPPSRRRNVF